MQDILCHVHSLLPLRDAARAACVSHVFLISWRCRPNLYFNTEALGLEANCGRTSRDFTKIVDHILKKYSDIGLKTFQLAMYGCYYIESCHLDSWLHLALTLGIEELILATNSMVPKYNFPLSLLSGKSGNSIRYLRLSFCIFRPTVRLGCFKSLKKLHLYCVGISGDELGYLLPVSVALEQLELAYCNKIICLKIPHVLQRLSCLDVAACHNLQMIKSEAPNLSSLCFEWFHHHVHTSLGEALHIASIPSEHSKFCSLKYLNICVPGEVRGPVYDYLSLASFLGASPCLETFILRIHVPEVRVKYGLFSGDPSHPRQMPEHRYVKLKRAKIIGFYPAKSLLELASHVLETATSLECLTLDTTYCSCGRRHSDPAKCYLVAIKRYFEGKVPSTARLDVEGPFSGVRPNDQKHKGCWCQMLGT
uniref:At1g61320/AtMIF1 LRR domain-containing protein n=1 Tax=Setaria viridis TaxID=4556 RepID=A0A4U6VVG4_SETVI|nr:hypothetical protein SEVIR_2G272500v2 [Setaria viridis]